MNQYHPTFDLKINVGHCDLYFMVHLLKTISCMNIIIWDYYQYDLMHDLKINVGHCDLYFIGQ